MEKPAHLCHPATPLQGEGADNPALTCNSRCINIDVNKGVNITES